MIYNILYIYIYIYVGSRLILKPNLFHVFILIPEFMERCTKWNTVKILPKHPIPKNSLPTARQRAMSLAKAKDERNAAIDMADAENSQHYHAVTYLDSIVGDIAAGPRAGFFDADGEFSRAALAREL